MSLKSFSTANLSLFASSSCSPSETVMDTVASVEAGGSHMVVAICRNDEIVEREEFPTTTPQETLAKMKAWLHAREFSALGVASFGPIDLDETSKTYGYITSTPKKGWAMTNMLGTLAKAGIPCGFDTDVNAAALAEAQRLGVRSLAYVTVGTGVGVGVLVDGELVHGLLHPEAGHMFVPAAPGDTNQPGTCPYHGALCVEGNASSGALAKRAGVEAPQLKDLPDEHPMWELTAHYLACMCANVIFTASPERIVLGGGIFQRGVLLEAVRKQTQRLLANYLQHPLITERISDYIVPARTDAGVWGGVALAKRALERSSKRG